MNEDVQLSKVRNVALDVTATSHMMQSYKSGEESWTCKCFACNYVRRSPRVAEAIAKAIVKHSKVAQ